MSRTPSTIGLALVTLFGGVLIAIGGMLAFRPTLLLERVPELQPLLEQVDPGLLVLVLVVLFVLLAPAVGIAGRFRPSSTTPLVEDESTDRTESRYDDRPGGRPARQSVVGGTADEQIGLATAYDDEPRDSREGAREALLESLRPIAATAYANRAGIADDDAMAAIEAGTWTDDPRAAAFLAGADGPSTPLWLWLFDLVSAADPFERSLERTLDEIETLQSAATVAGPPVRETDSTGDELTDGVTA